MFKKKIFKIIKFLIFLLLFQFNNLFANFTFIIQNPINFIEKNWDYICNKEICKLNLKFLNNNKNLSKDYICKLYIWLNNLVSEKCNPNSIEIDKDENIVRFEIYKDNNIIWSKELILYKELKKIDKIIENSSKKDISEKVKNKINNKIKKQNYKKTLNYKISKLKSWLKISWESRKFNNLILYFWGIRINISVKNWNFIYKTTQIQSWTLEFQFFWVNDNDNEIFIKSWKTKITKNYINDINKYYIKKNNNNKNIEIWEKQDFNKSIKLNIKKAKTNEIDFDIKKEKNDSIFTWKNILNILYILLIPFVLILIFIILKKKKLLQKSKNQYNKKTILN